MNFSSKTKHSGEIKDAKTLCRQYQIQPLRRRGQNFLTNARIYDKIIEAAELDSNDLVLEIGPGLGALTTELAQRVKKVIAVEIDRKLVEILDHQLAHYKNIEIIQGDILDPQLLWYLGTRLIRKPNKKNQINQLTNCPIKYKVVANLPYNITGAVLRKFLAEQLKPKLMVLMLQKEVAQRIVAKSPKMSLLSVMVQFYGQLKIISYVSKNNFWPRPKVDSAIIRITPTDTDRRHGLTRTIDEKYFFEIVRAGFSSPRKFLLSNLVKRKIITKESGQEIFAQIGFNFKIRAGELPVDNWIKLYEVVETKK